MPPRRARKSKETIEAEVRGDNAADIAGVYDAPFPIYSEKEGERYKEHQTKSIEVPTYFNFEVLDQIGLTGRLMGLCRRGKWDWFVRMNYPVYRDLTLEFFTSLRFASSKPKKLWCKLRGQVCVIDDRVLQHIFGFTEKDIDDGHQCFSISLYWRPLTDLDEYDPHTASNAPILSANLTLLHKFMCGAIFGKQQSTKYLRKEVFLLWCIEHGHKPNMFTYVSKTLIECVGRKGNSLGMGYVATALAENLRIDISDLDMMNPHYFDVLYLKRCEIIDDKTVQLRDPSTCTALKRRLAAAEASSEGHGTEYCFGTEWQQPRPQQQLPQHQPQLDWAMFYTLMVEHHRSTQQQLGEMKQQMNILNQRVEVIRKDLQYVSDKMEKAWEMQGLDVPTPSSSAPGSPKELHRYGGGLVESEAKDPPSAPIDSKQGGLPLKASAEAVLPSVSLALHSDVYHPGVPLQRPSIVIRRPVQELTRNGRVLTNSVAYTMGSALGHLRGVDKRTLKLLLSCCNNLWLRRQHGKSEALHL